MWQKPLIPDMRPLSLCPTVPLFKTPASRLRGLVLLLVLLAGASPARAQLSDEAQVSLITILPGDQVYSLFGHSALRVYDPARSLLHSSRGFCGL